MATTKITSPELFDLGSLNTALKLPSGTTAQRPTSPSTGEWRYNTTTNLVEFWDGGAWRDLQSEDIPPIPSENFNVVLYTGNGSTQSITGVGFKPDFVWVKERSGVGSGPLADSTRGTGKAMYSNLTDADYTFPAGQGVTSFDADGFSIGDDASGNGGYNGNGVSYVAWCWKANGGTTSSNTDGTQTSTVQVNTKAGFSIAQYTASAAGASESVGHGLGTTPAMIILKRTDSTEDWYVWHKDLGAGGSALNQFLRLNSTSSQATATNLFNTVNSTVFNPSYTSSVPNTNIAYCFAEKAEYSKFGSYTGNGSTNGPVVNTGFEPAYIMIKNSTSTYEWTVYDNKRSTSNPRNNVLYPNTNGAENSGETGDINFLTNGFQPKAAAGSINQSGGTIIYAAFASDPSAAPVLLDSFANKLWTGNSSARDINVGFSPSWTWIKSRSFARNNYLYDILRGPNNQILSNDSGAQATITGRLTAFNTGGFSLGTDSEVNNNAETYVAWNWKANALPTINTDGTIQSVVSANQAAGFSIVSYTGTGSSGTYGHGLSSSPDWIITKRTDAVEGWIVWSSSLSASNYMYLNGSGAAGTDTNAYKTIGATTNQIGTDVTVNASGGEYISYCFTSISGFSDFGSYTGNGGAGYAITGLGFQPSFIMIKGTTSADNWFIFDSARGDSVTLNPNLPAVEYADTGVTSFDSDGFTLGSNVGGNRNGDTYIYMAFKENPSPIVPAGQMAFLTVAGGGSGFAAWGGGGGGAGGLRTSFGSTSGGGASAESNVTLYSGTYTITVGAGGAGGTGEPQGGGGDNSNNGAGSSLAGPSITTITSTGGGGAGDVSTGATGKDGGSGGGGSAQFRNYNGPYGVSGPGGAGTANQGFDGSTAEFQGGNNSYNAGGGGGGASAAGTNASFANAGAGGDGLTVLITGSGTTYAGGGGGGIAGLGSAGSGGSGGGGNGSNSGTGTAGTANTGGGGGGTYRYGNTFAAGGSGVVVLRMRTTDYSGTTTGSPTITTRGEETILTYTGSGTYVHS